jgi:hypothetical protein
MRIGGEDSPDHVVAQVPILIGAAVSVHLTWRRSMSSSQTVSARAICTALFSKSLVNVVGVPYQTAHCSVDNDMTNNR